MHDLQSTLFLWSGEPIVDAVISLTGFSLVGGPAYNDTDAAQALLSNSMSLFVGAGVRVSKSSGLGGFLHRD
jgi:hypothetical protein